MASAIFFGLPAHGHTNPTLPIVAELVRQGEQIIYYSTEAFHAPIEATGNEFYRCCFEAFEQSDYQVVMSIGKHTTREQLDPTPENFMVCQSVPQLELLQRATLFITHAGMNSTNVALYYGVPLPAIPQATDQHYIARRIEQSGAGIRLSPKQVTASRLRNSADEIRTHAKYAQASARIGASLRQAGGIQAALQAIQQFKQRYHIEL